MDYEHSSGPQPTPVRHLKRTLAHLESSAEPRGKVPTCQHSKCQLLTTPSQVRFGVPRRSAIASCCRKVRNSLNTLTYILNNQATVSNLLKRKVNFKIRKQLYQTCPQYYKGRMVDHRRRCWSSNVSLILCINLYLTTTLGVKGFSRPAVRRLQTSNCIKCAPSKS